MAVSAIEVQGLREFSRALKRLDAELPKQLRKALNDAANIVVADAQHKVPKRTGKAAASIKASSTQTAARIKGGGARVQYYGWLDFGGRVGRGRHGKGTGSVYRQFRKAGRYIWVSFAEKKPEVMEGLQKAIADAAHAAGLVATDGE